MRACPLLLLSALGLLLGACAPRPVTLADRLGLPPLAMVSVEGGPFAMGDVFEGTDDDATPVHLVTVEDFQIGRYEVTFEAYDAFARATARPLPPDDGGERGRRAVVHVTWDDAVAFCAAYGYRLPTEAEWEFAAREGGKRLRYAGTSASDSLRAYGWVHLDDEAHSFPVGQKRPNALGIYDLSGNVAEWVGAFYAFYPAPGATPEWQDMAQFGMRIARGGSYHQEPALAQTFRRAATLHDLGASDLGFRCAADGR